MPRPAGPAAKAPTDRTRARRAAYLADYDPAVIRAILDAMPVAHVGYVLDGAPVVTPTLQWREGDRVYWHGSSASRMLKKTGGAPVCLTVTLTDGMVLARSGLEHSVNYRSVMIFGRAEAVTRPEAKEMHLREFMEAHFPGRWDALRPMTAQELKATAILSMPITEASAKVSSGMPKDPESDRSWPVWAGVVPLSLVTGQAVADPQMPGGIALPDYLKRYAFSR